MSPAPSAGTGKSRRNGFEVNRMNKRNPTPIIAWTARTRARNAGGRLWLNPATVGAEQREDEHPQQHRAFVVAPHPAQLVQQRLHAAGIRRDIGQREVADRIGVHQHEKGDRDEEELGERRRPRPAHQCRIVARRADERHHACNAAMHSASTRAKCPISSIMVRSPSGRVGRRAGIMRQSSWDRRIRSHIISWHKGAGEAPLTRIRTPVPV